MYIGKKEIHRYMWAGQQIKEKYQNGCYLKTTGQNHQLIDVHIWDTHVHMHTKYEAAMSNPVPGEVSTDDDDTNTNTNDTGRRYTTDKA